MGRGVGGGRGVEGNVGGRKVVDVRAGEWRGKGWGEEGEWDGQEEENGKRRGCEGEGEGEERRREEEEEESFGAVREEVRGRGKEKREGRVGEGVAEERRRKEGMEGE